jgi:ABC-type bacteriocin/lantibiotic exporter with double-glycine peptidase domain
MITLAATANRFSYAGPALLELQLWLVAAALFISTAVANLERLERWRSHLELLSNVASEAAHNRYDGVMSPTEGSRLPLRCAQASFKDEGTPGQTLDQVDFELRGGDRLAIVGECGTGKTLLAEMLLGLRAPTGGAVMIGGTSVGDLSEKTRRALIGGVFSDAEPYGASLRDFFHSGARLTDRDIHRACTIVGLHGLLSQLPLGLQTPVNRDAAVFGAAERRLLCLAKLIALAPTTMVIDGVLDSFDQARAFSIARALAAESPAVILMTSRPEILPSSYRRINIVKAQIGDRALG